MSKASVSEGILVVDSSTSESVDIGLARTLAELLRLRAEGQPDRRAYVFLRDGEVEDDALTYAELDARARVIASGLLQHVAPGDRALLVYPPGLEFVAAFFACLYAGVVAVPCQLPSSARRNARLLAIIQDAGARLVLTGEATVERLAGHGDELRDMVVLATDTMKAGQAAVVEAVSLPARTAPHQLAYLQYTSGSTGTPKGVMITHDNLLRNSMALDESWQHDEKSLLVSWLPTFHDMGLVYGILQPIYRGFPCVLMSPVAFLRRPMRWLEAISRYGGTHSVAPNFAYDLCARASSPEDRRRLDLSSWRMAASGSEPIRDSTLRRFAEVFAESGFKAEALCPGYGLAEATLGVTATHVDARRVTHPRDSEHSADDADASRRQPLVGCGPALLDTRILIVDQETHEALPSYRVGEIWVAGSIVAKGYWRNDEATLETFAAYEANTGEGPFLRTGDLGFVDEAGELFVSGRLKDLIVVRGRNHYPQDLERTVQESHEALEPDAGAAFSIDVDGEERVVVVQEVRRSKRRQLEIESVANAVRQAVFEEHELALHHLVLLRPGSLPKTSSGKIRRRACQQGYLEGSLRILDQSGPGSSSEGLPEQASAQPLAEERPLGELRVLAAEVLGIEAVKIDTEAPLGNLGFDSMHAVLLIEAIERRLHVELPFEILLGNPSLAHLARTLRSAPDGRVAPDAGSLVPIQPRGSRPPLFCVHPMGGIVYPYYELARQLGPEQAFYGLQSAGLYAERPDSTIEEMGVRYVEAIRTIQPEGPYFLCGWSFGAFAAYEVARLLAEAGEEVAFLGILDMPLLSRFKVRPLAKLRFLGVQLPIMIWPLVFDYLRLVAGTGQMHPSLAEARFGSWRRLVKTTFRELASLFSRGSTLRRVGRVMRRNSVAMHDYDPLPYRGPATFYRTDPPLVPGDDDPTFGWRELALGGVEVESIEGKHMDLLAKPHVESLARQMDRRISRLLGETTHEQE